MSFSLSGKEPFSCARMTDQKFHEDTASSSTIITTTTRCIRAALGTCPLTNARVLPTTEVDVTSSGNAGNKANQISGGNLRLRGAQCWAAKNGQQ